MNEDLSFTIRAIDQARQTFAAIGRHVQHLQQQMAQANAAMQRGAHATAQAWRQAGQTIGRVAGEVKQAAGEFGRAAGSSLNLGDAVKGLGTVFAALRGPLGAVLGVLQALGGVISGVVGFLGNLVAAALDAARAIGGALLEALERVAGILGGVLAAGLAALAGGMVAIGNAGVDMNLTLEGAHRSFTRLLGSEQAATAFLEELRKEALLSTPTLKDLLQQAPLLAQAFGPEKIGQVIRTLRAFGDAAGTNLEGAKLALLQFRQILTRGFISQEEISTISEHLGVSVGKILLETFGTADSELLKKAGVTGEQVALAIVAGLEKQFGGAQAAASKTLPGILSGLQDQFNELSGQVTQGFTARITEAAASVLEFARSLSQTAEGQRFLANLTLAFNFIGDALKGLVGQLPQALSWFNRITDSIPWKTLSDVAQNAWEMIVSGAQAAVGWLAANWPQIWKTIQGVVIEAGAQIGGVIAGLVAVFQYFQGDGRKGLETFGNDLKEFAALGVRALGELAKMFAFAGAMALQMGGSFALAMGNVDLAESLKRMAAQVGRTGLEVGMLGEKAEAMLQGRRTPGLDAALGSFTKPAQVFGEARSAFIQNFRSQGLNFFGGLQDRLFAPRPGSFAPSAGGRAAPAGSPNAPGHLMFGSAGGGGGGLAGGGNDAVRNLLRQKELEESLKARRAYFEALAEQARFMAGNANEDERALTEAEALIPVLLGRIRGVLLPTLQLAKQGTAEYFQAQGELWQARSEIQGLQRRAAEEEHRNIQKAIDATKKARQDARQLQAAQLQLAEAQLANNPFLTERQRKQAMLPLLLRQFRALSTGGAGETELEGVQRAIEAERVRGQIFEGAGVTGRSFRLAGGGEFAGADPLRFGALNSLLGPVSPGIAGGGRGGNVSIQLMLSGDPRTWGAQIAAMVEELWRREVGQATGSPSYAP